MASGRVIVTVSPATATAEAGSVSFTVRNWFVIGSLRSREAAVPLRVNETEARASKRTAGRPGNGPRFEAPPRSTPKE